jgi:hypothetical protein
MEQIKRTYSICGEQVKVPMAMGGGDLQTRNRYKVLTEAIAECLWICPRSDRVLMTALQTAWAEAERLLRAIGPSPDDQSEIKFE